MARTITELEEILIFTPTLLITETKLPLLLAILLCLCSCQPKTSQQAKLSPIKSEIQILNACGISGAASEVRQIIKQKGFDVVEVGNNSEQNFQETIIAIRKPSWNGLDSLTSRLKTSNFIFLENPKLLVDATIFVGKDYKEWIQHVQ